MLSSCGGRLLGGSEQAAASLSSSSGLSGGLRHTSQVELLINSGSTSNSSEAPDFQRSLLSGGDQALLTNGGGPVQWQRGQQQPLTKRGDKQDEFVNANDTIFTLSDNLKQQQHHHQQQLQQQQQQQLAGTNYLLGSVNVMPDARHDDSLPPPPMSKVNIDGSLHHLGSSSKQPKPLHRHLQYQPIHQQLQRIYGNKLQEFEQLARQQNQKSATKSSGNDCGQPQPTMIKQQEHAFTTTAVNGRFHNQERHHHCHKQADNALYQHEQTYDSLNVIDPPPPPPSTVGQNRHQVSRKQQQYQQGIYELNPRLPQASQDPIRAIPEECSIHDQNNNVIMSKRTTIEHEYAEDEGEEEEEEDDDEDEDELVEDEKHNLLLRDDAHQIARQSSRVLISNRKRQMESLHYATATAAALLNVTASAAAAFAASDKQLVMAKRKQHQKPKVSAPGQRLAPAVPGIGQSSLNQIYSDSYQKAGFKAQQNDQYQQLYHGIQYAEQNRRKLQVRQHQLNHQRQQQQQHMVLQPRPSMTSQRPDIHRFDASQSGTVHNQYLNHAGMVRMSNQQQLRVMTRQPQMAPQQIMTRPAGVSLTNQHIEMIRRCKQSQHQRSTRQAQPAIFGVGSGSIYNKQQNAPVTAPLALTANGIPALAILQPPKGKPAEADFMTRLAANNKQKLVMTAAASDPRLLMLTSGLQNGAFAKSQEQRRQQQEQQVTYGLVIAAHGNKQQQQIYATGPLLLKKQPEQSLTKAHYQIGPITSDASDASGHSNLPLILNRGVVKPKLSILDKISHIDLTIFWWVLSIICVLFITAVVTITRYLM